MIKEEIEDLKIIEQWLKLEIKTPKKGEKLRFIEMAEKNAQITLNNKTQIKTNLLSEFKELLKLEKSPRKIESYDISNISGTHMVGAMVVLQDLAIKKNLKRIFKIKTVFTQDDPKCMEEMLERRFKHTDEKFGTLPDVIFVDGGITQIRSCEKSNGKIQSIYSSIRDDKR